MYVQPLRRADNGTIRGVVEEAKRGSKLIARRARALRRLGWWWVVDSGGGWCIKPS